MGYKTDQENRAAEGSVKAILGQLTSDDRRQFMTVLDQLKTSSTTSKAVARVKQIAEEFLKDGKTHGS
jgi:hypothetical protein